jgi:uncharacterized protein
MSKHPRMLALYEKLEKLISKLPGALQKPILGELEPVKKLFLMQRAPRIVLLGQRGAGKAHLVNALFGAEVLPAHETRERGASGWQEIAHAGHGAMSILDARRPALSNAIKNALAAEAPDIFLFVRSTSEIDAEFAEDLDRCIEILNFTDPRSEGRPGMIALLLKAAHEGDADAALDRFHAALLTKPEIAGRLVAAMTVCPFVRFRMNGSIDPEHDERKNIDRLALAIADELPQEAKLEIARLCGVRPVQSEIAQTLIKSVTAICTAVGTQPIPIADFPVLTTLQVMMVAGIGYISGRAMSAKLAAEFIAALGANIGAGLVLREGARALAKLFPGWGNAVSGAIAGAGTYAIGRAASGYFVDGISIKDARRLFRRNKRGRRNELME